MLFRGVDRDRISVEVLPLASEWGKEPGDAYEVRKHMLQALPKTSAFGHGLSIGSLAALYLEVQPLYVFIKSGRFWLVH